MPPRLSGKGVKSGGPPVFSVEFFIANHADIISTFCTIIFVGLVFQVSSTALSLLARAAGACMAAASCVQHRVRHFGHVCGNRRAHVRGSHAVRTFQPQP